MATLKSRGLALENMGIKVRLQKDIKTIILLQSLFLVYCFFLFNYMIHCSFL